MLGLARSGRPVVASCCAASGKLLLSNQAIRRSAVLTGLLCLQPALAQASQHHRGHRAHTHTQATMAGEGANLTYPAPIVLGPRGEHKGTVIMLHGLGDTGEGWADIGQMFAPSLPNTK